MEEAGELPTRLAILPFRNRVLLPGAIVRIQCTSPSSVKLVEQELWQKEEKGLIGVLPVKDAEKAAAGSMLSPDAGTDAEDPILKGPDDASESHEQDGQSNPEPVRWHNRLNFHPIHLLVIYKVMSIVFYCNIIEGCGHKSSKMNRGAWGIVTKWKIPLNHDKSCCDMSSSDGMGVGKLFSSTATAVACGSTFTTRFIALFTFIIGKIACQI